MAPKKGRRNSDQGVPSNNFNQTQVPSGAFRPAYTPSSSAPKGGRRVSQPLPAPASGGMLPATVGEHSRDNAKYTNRKRR